MLRLPTVVLQHDTTTDTHFDWLIADPTLVSDPDARLWTARIAIPPSAWPVLRTWRMTQICHHRRAYLTYQGPVAGDRGIVRRVAQGWITPLLWCAHRITIDIDLSPLRGRIELCEFIPGQWRAKWLG